MNECWRFKVGGGAVQVCLVKPGPWKGIWNYALGPAEDALCVKAMQLKNAKTGASSRCLPLYTATVSFFQLSPCLLLFVFFLAVLPDRLPLHSLFPSLHLLLLPSMVMWTVASPTVLCSSSQHGFCPGRGAQQCSNAAMQDSLQFYSQASLGKLR